MFRDKDIIFSEKEEIIPKEIYALAISSIISIATFKYLMNSINNKGVTPIDLKGSSVDYKTYLEDFYGGEEVKIVFRETIHFLKNPQVY